MELLLVAKLIYSLGNFKKFDLTSLIYPGDISLTNDFASAIFSGDALN